MQQATPIATMIIGVLLLANFAAGAASSQTASTDSNFDCLIEPRLKVKLGSPLSGVLEQVNVERAQTVQKGDVIAKLQTLVEERNIALAQHRALAWAGAILLIAVGRS